MDSLAEDTQRDRRAVPTVLLIRGVAFPPALVGGADWVAWGGTLSALALTEAYKQRRWRRRPPLEA